jgi:hypothetical protein
VVDLSSLKNPAVSFALCLTKNITPFRAAILTVSQVRLFLVPPHCLLFSFFFSWQTISALS